MVILVNLANRLLSKALAAQVGALTDHRILVYEKGKCNDDIWVPEVVLCDPVTCREEICRQWPGAKCLLVDTGMEEQELFLNLSSRKIEGVLTMDMDPCMLGKALLAVKKGDFWLPHQNLKSILQRMGSSKNNGHPPELKDKDQRILEFISRGYKNREIAERLHLSEQTIKSHVSRIFRLLHVSNRAQLVRLVVENHTPGLSRNSPP